MNNKRIDKAAKENNFSGAVYVERDGKVLINEAYGFADKSNLLPNKVDTKFGIASGCKVFTAVSVLQLVDRNLLDIDTPLKDCLSIDFPQFDSEVKVHHLLNHCAGIPDYFDEEEMDDFSVLWERTPMYKIKELRDFLPMFKDNKMDFKPGERFKYNNAGFILLGLIVEEISGLDFRSYVQKNIFEPCMMDSSGYYPLDKLPVNTAYGYEKDENDEWKTNIYSIPIIGGADGGAFTTTYDMARFWRALKDYELLSKKMTDEMLSPQIQVDDDCYYGHGVWLISENNKVKQYYVVGEDPGVTMISSVFPDDDIQLTILANTEYGTWNLSSEIEDMLGLRG